MAELYSSKEGNTKCLNCYWLNDCMLLTNQGELCLGPFKDLKDCLAKIRADRKTEETRHEKFINKDELRANVDVYRYNCNLFDDPDDADD